MGDIMMGMADYTSKFQVQFSMSDAFTACKEAVRDLDKIQIDSVNEIMHTITLSTGKTLFSWGEIITITILQLNENASEIAITSTCKNGALGNMNDMGKNQKNITQIIQAISDELRKINE